MSDKAKFWTAFALGIVTSVTLIFMASCGHHRHRHTIKVKDSPFTVAFVNSRTDIERQDIINGLKDELDLWSAQHGESKTDITVVVENDIDIEVEGDIDEVNHQIKCRPKNKKCHIYHALCKWHNKKCKRNVCLNNPKPCDNED